MTRGFRFVPLALSIVSPVFAATPREDLKAVVAAVQKSPADVALREKAIALAKKLKPAPAVPEEAERRMSRGGAGVKAAAGAAEFKDAAAEFELASLAAPWLADAYYNAGVAWSKAGEHASAARNYKLYVAAAKSAADVKDGKAKLAEEEFLLEKAAKADARFAGLWAVTMDGQVSMMFGKRMNEYRADSLGGGKYRVTRVRFTGTDVQSSEHLDLTMADDAASGVYTWDGNGPDGKRLCPALSSPAAGTVSDDGMSLQLSYESRMFETGCRPYRQTLNLTKVE